MQEIIKNIETGVENGENKTKAVQLLEKTEELEALDAEVKTLRYELLQKMKATGIKSIKTDYGKQFIRAERKNIKVDNEKAYIYLDSIGATEEFSKLDTTKITKVYDDKHDFVLIGEPTEYLTIKSCD